jgi:hypothetical protein
MIRTAGPTMSTLTLMLSLAFITANTSGCRDRARTMETSPETPAETTATEPAEDRAVDADVPDSLLFGLERTACFGTCPSYRLFIYEGGRATYHGYGHVELMGHYETEVDTALMGELVREAEELGFFGWKAEYDSPVTDLPSTIITIRHKGDTKRVKGRVSPPAGFNRLAARAEELLLALPWREVAGEE